MFKMDLQTFMVHEPTTIVSLKLKTDGTDTGNGQEREAKDRDSMVKKGVAALSAMDRGKQRRRSSAKTAS